MSNAEITLDFPDHSIPLSSQKLHDQGITLWRDDALFSLSFCVASKLSNRRSFFSLPCTGLYDLSSFPFLCSPVRLGRATWTNPRSPSSTQSRNETRRRERSPALLYTSLCFIKSWVAAAAGGPVLLRNPNREKLDSAKAKTSLFSPAFPFLSQVQGTLLFSSIIYFTS